MEFCPRTAKLSLPHCRFRFHCDTFSLCQETLFYPPELLWAVFEILWLNLGIARPFEASQILAYHCKDLQTLETNKEEKVNFSGR